MAQADLFTYQGRLQDRGQPANGNYDFQFRLCDGLYNYIGPIVTNGSLVVSNGLFTLPLDFGDGVINGSRCSLEIGVRTNGSAGPYTILMPRQQITPAPQATFAKRAATADVATILSGGGAVLTNVPATSLTGIVPLSQLAGITSSQLDSSTWQMATNQSVPVINVKDYGAAGNGVQDDTLAISNAWNQFLATGGTLFFPAGIYVDSGTHIQNTWVSGEPVARNGRLILGLGSVIWIYTGASHLLEGQNSFPDIDGIEFRCVNTSATNCIYATTLFNKWAVRNCYFYGWNNTSVGALVIDDSDSVTISSTSFLQCNIGLGLGYKCNGFKGDIWAGNCGTAVAVGVPTRNEPWRRDSQDVFLNVMTLYCGTSVAIDSFCDVTIKGFHWWATSPIIIGSIPGISTNYGGPLNVTVDQNYFTSSSSVRSPIQLYSGLNGRLTVGNCIFQATESNAPPVIKSWAPQADSVAIDWSSTQLSNVRPYFETSTGQQLTDPGFQQHKFSNHSLAIHSNRQMGNAGYLVDAVSSADRNSSYPVARMGLNWSPSQFDDFWGGLNVQYDHQTDIPVVQVTNSDLYVTGSRPGSGSSGGQVYVSGTVNATNGFVLGTVKILSGSGSPEGAVAAPVGSLYLRTDGGTTNTLYVKGTGAGNSGWIAK